MQMKAWYLFVGLVPNLLALDITTLDCKTFRDCEVSKVYPDSICVLYGGSGARIKFTNLPEPVRVKYGYDAERAAAFEQSEAMRVQREQAFLNAQRLQLAAQQRASVAATNQATASPSQTYPATGSEYVGVRTAAAAASGYGNTGAGGQFGNQSGNQFGNGFAGAQYVGVRMAGPGGIRGVTAPTATQPRPPGNLFP
jgi:hypothetical protein